MDWMDIACIVFACVTVNHLGLIAAIKMVTRCSRLWVLDCPKCLTFWSVIIYGIAVANSTLFTIHYALRLLAISFLCAYLAIWLELLEGLIDKLYLKIYGKIYPTTNTPDTDAERA